MADMADRILPLLSPGGPALPPDVVAVLTEAREALREHEARQLRQDALLDRRTRVEAGVVALRDELRAELPDLHPMARVRAVEVVTRISARLDALLETP